MSTLPLLYKERRVSCVREKLFLQSHSTTYIHAHIHTNTETIDRLSLFTHYRQAQVSGREITFIEAKLLPSSGGNISQRVMMKPAAEQSRVPKIGDETYCSSLDAARKSSSSSILVRQTCRTCCIETLGSRQRALSDGKSSMDIIKVEPSFIRSSLPEECKTNFNCA